MQAVIETFEQYIESLADESVDRIRASNHPFYSQLPRERLRQAVGMAFKMVLADLTSGENTNFAGYLLAVSAQRAQEGAAPSDIMSGFEIGITTASDMFKRELAEDPRALGWWFERIHQIMQVAAMRLSDKMLEAREQLIYSQASVIQELSTPIMPVSDAVLVAPVVGAIDSRRANQMMERLLEGILEHQAEVAIIDITGVPLVDTSVANHLLQTARAARLLGAEVILVGIGAAIAQTMVQAGVDFTGITVAANLQAGLSHALQIQAQSRTAEPLN
jgi:rsbT co-antagonist protein RsbR